MNLFRVTAIIFSRLLLQSNVRCYNDVLFSYGGYGDLASRRKNATRESTATLKAWLNEHKKNPYPTKGEKIMLAIITKMTLTQVTHGHMNIPSSTSLSTTAASFVTFVNHKATINPFDPLVTTFPTHGRAH